MRGLGCVQDLFKAVTLGQANVTLAVTHHTLVRGAVYDSQEGCCGRETLIPVPHLYEEQMFNCVNGT